jgi:hypothetical protein
MCPLSAAHHEHIITLLQSGVSGHSIHISTGASLGTISKICSEYCSELSKSSGGRPTKLTPSNIAYAKHLIRMQKVDNAVQVTKSLQDITNLPLSSQTVRCALRTAGLRPVVKKKRPLLKATHRRERLQWAERYQEYTVADWKRVVWSDETKINRLGSDGRKWVWKEVGEGLTDRQVEGTLKFGGGSVMMWGCMLWEGVGYSCRIEGKMDAELYCSILGDELEKSLQYYGKTVGNVLFQQDNDPKHTSKLAQKWFKDHGYTVMKWPAQSPDLNPIEHLWWHLKKRLAEYETPARGLEELWERVQVEWEKILPETCQKLIESMPRRVEAVIKAKGGYTKY